MRRRLAMLCDRRRCERRAPRRKVRVTVERDERGKFDLVSSRHLHLTRNRWLWRRL